MKSSLFQPRNGVSLLVGALLVAACPLHLVQAAPIRLAQAATGKIDITVVVIEDLQRKPVPLTDFRVVGNGASQTVRTGEDGKCHLKLEPGSYRFESVVPLSYKGRSLQWAMPFSVVAGQNPPLIFTDGDAQTPNNLTPVASVAPLTSGAKLEIAEGTKIRLELAQPISSNRVRKGEEVRLFLKDPILGPNKEVLVKAGASAFGVVTYAKGAGSFGKKGKLEFSIDSLTAADDTKVPLRSSQAAGGKNNALGGAAGIILLGPLMGFVKGKNITLNQGTIFDAYIDKTTPVLPAK